MRRLRISTRTLRAVAGDKDMIDALAFAVLVKQTYVSGVVRNATQSSMKRKFGCGSDKLRKVMKSGFEAGFLRWDGKDLVACRLHGNRELTYLFKVNRFCESMGRKGKLSIVGIRAMIEEAIIVNHVRIQSEVSDTHHRASSPLNVQQLRSARRKESRMLGKPYSEDYAGLSNRRIQELIGRGHNKASRIIKKALGHKYVDRQFRAYGVDMHGDPCNAVTKSFLEDTGVIVWLRMRCAWVRFSNEYRYTARDIIGKANNGRKFC